MLPVDSTVHVKTGKAIYRKRSADLFQYQLREHDNLESKREYQLEIINKEIHEIFTNFQYLYLEKVLSNQPCE